MDLNAPLDRKPIRRRPALLLGLVAAGIAAGVGLVGVVLYRADPHGGEPFAVAAIPPVPASDPTAPASKGQIDPSPTGSVQRDAAGREDGPQDRSRVENGVRVTSPGSADRMAARDAGPQIIDVSKALDGSGRRTGNFTPANGRSPNARDTDAASTDAARPRIAILVGSLGLNDIATRTAVELMPSAVSLAFPPYGATLQQSVVAAHDKGHEIILQVPMQSATGTAPGPHALRVGERPDELDADLDWTMGRFDTYTGVTNLLGAGVTSDPATMSAVMTKVARRGLFYVDDGTSKGSQAVAIAASNHVPAIGVDVVLDATADPAMVRANLDRLVATAKAKGSAVGLASGLSDHLQAIARFAGDLQGRGITLVPVGSLARAGASVATTR